MIVPVDPADDMLTFGEPPYWILAVHKEVTKLVRADEERTLRLGGELLEPRELRRINRPVHGPYVVIGPVIRALQRVQQHEVRISKRNDACHAAWDTSPCPILGPGLKERRAPIVVSERQRQFDARMGEALQDRPRCPIVLGPSEGDRNVPKANNAFRQGAHRQDLVDRLLKPPSRVIKLRESPTHMEIGKKDRQVLIEPVDTPSPRRTSARKCRGTHQEFPSIHFAFSSNHLSTSSRGALGEL